ncbi:MAG: HEAT repeat domain-containing protein [Dehalococcoidia bacterium]|jgi:HEAT repeat protein|nr:HEAT repeat domain-containing protein [Dehalococcoidia bacterium]
MAIEWQKSLGELAAMTKAVSAARILALSDLSHSDVGAFREVWGGLLNERRRRIVDRMVELAEDDVELSFDTVFLICLDDSDRVVRLKAIEGLAESSEPFFIEPLLRLLRYDSDTSVRAEAAVALGKFSMLVELKKLRPSYGERLQVVLLDVLGDDNLPDEIRRRVVEAIAPMCNQRVTELIEETYANQHLDMRTSALYAMGRNCDTRWIPVLVRELTSSSVEIRYEAATALGELSDGDGVPYLAPLVHDDDAQVQEAAITALGKIGTNAAKLVLKAMAKETDDRLRDVALDALREAEAADDLSIPYE